MTIYKEDIYPAVLTVAVGEIWVFAPWIKPPKIKHWKRPSNMRVMVFAWEGPTIVAMSHQSLQ